MFKTIQYLLILCSIFFTTLFLSLLTTSFHYEVNLSPIKIMLKIIYPSLSKKVSIEAITLTTKKDGIHLRFRNLKTVNSNLKIPDLDLTIDYNLEKKNKHL